MAEGTVTHMEELLMAHTGDAERELKKVLKTNNVDIDAHFGGSIVGNHCMYMGEKGNAIMDGMTAAMLPKIKDDTNRQHLQAICDRMKPILSLWFEIMKTMKSVDCQSDEDCERFKENIIKMNKAIHSLITNPPVPGCGLNFSKQLKSHLLFDWEILDFLLRWRTLGGVDEQNVEGTHPRFNQLARMFGNIRGGLKQKKIVEEFLFSNSTWIVDTIDEMLGKTKRKKGTKSRVRKRRANKNNGNPTVDGGMICEADDSKDDVMEGNPDEMNSDNKADEGESLDCVTAGLTDREVGINTNTSFHTFKDVDTKIHVCATCKCRLLSFAEAVHCHEIHTVHIDGGNEAE